MKNLKLMKYFLPFLIFLLTSLTTLSGQESIIEKLGGVKLDCTLTTEENKILSKESYLIKRVVSKKLNSLRQNLGDIDSSNGYEAFHLEFVTKEKIKSISKGDKKNRRLTIIFYDKNGTAYGNVVIERTRFNKFLGENNKLNTYSINLKGIPLIWFENVHTIDLTFINRN